MAIKDALRKQDAYRIDGGRWEVVQWWDLDHPDCPIVLFGDARPWFRRYYPTRSVMTEQEYQRRFGGMN